MFVRLSTAMTLNNDFNLASLGMFAVLPAGCRWIFAALVVTVLYSPATAQQVLSQEDVPFVFRSWNLEDGLPHNSVTSIAQTPDGYLWLGTYNGLARFDGVHCHTLGLKDGLRSLRISALLLDSHQTLWIGTVGGGLSRLNHGKIETLTSADGLASDTVNGNTLMEDKDGTIWIGTTGGLNQWKNGTLTSYDEGGLKNEYISALAADHLGTIWIATIAPRLIRIQSGHPETVSRPPDLTLVESMMVDAQNRLWVGTPNGKVLCRNNEDDTWTTFGPTNGLPNAIVNALTQSPDGTIWAGTLDQGIYYLRNGKFTGLREYNGLSSDSIYALFVDYDQFLWVGTRAGGLCRLTPRHLYGLKILENGTECFPQSLAETSDGKMWVGTSGRGLFQWDGTAFNQFLREPPISNHLFVRTVLAGRDGSLWWGAGPVLYQWKQGHLASQFDANNTPWLRGDRVSALCKDLNDGLWVGTYNGQLRHLKGNSFDSVGKLGSQPITDIVQQQNGALWVGTLGGGLVRIQDGNQTTLTEKDGLGSALVQTLFLDREENLWIGTVGGGLGRWHAGKLDFYGSQQGLVDDSITEIVEDDMNYLWLGCNHGIMRVSKSEIETASSRHTTSIHSQVFGWRDGMLSEQCVIGFNAALKASDGRLYFSTSKGIVVVDPNEHLTKASPPRVMLEKIMVDGNDETAKFGGTTFFPPDQSEVTGKRPPMPEIAPGPQEIQFQFTGLSFDAPELVQFRYQLEGVDSVWQSAGNNRIATYAHLPPGNYVFHVIACNAQGIWNQSGASVGFVVLPFFWQRAWFMALVCLAGVIATASIALLAMQWRYRNRLKFLEMERATENERARIARDLHDEVGSSLTRISMLSDQVHSRLNDPEQLKARARKLSDFAVHTTQTFEEIVWAVNPRNDSFRSLFEYLTHFANELFENSGISCRFEIPDDLPENVLPPETRHGIFLAIKEAFNNIAKHSGASQATLHVDLDPRSLLIIVQDNGKGFEKDRPPANDADHNGLLNMRQRIENLGGQFEIETQPGHGTIIRIKFACEKLALHKPVAQR